MNIYTTTEPLQSIKSLYQFFVKYIYSKNQKLMFGLTKMQPQVHLYSMKKTLCKYTFYSILSFFQEKVISIVPLSQVNSNYTVHFCKKKAIFNVIQKFAMGGLILADQNTVPISPLFNGKDIVLIYIFLYISWPVLQLRSSTIPASTV